MIPSESLVARRSEAMLRPRPGLLGYEDQDFEPRSEGVTSSVSRVCNSNYWWNLATRITSATEANEIASARILARHQPLCRLDEEALTSADIYISPRG